MTAAMLPARSRTVAEDGALGRAPELRRLAAACVAPSATPLFDGHVDTALSQAAHLEDLAPRLGERLTAGLITADEVTARRLTRARHTCVARTLVMDLAVRSTASSLQSRAIPVLCLKGAALVRTVFAPGSRSMSDVDLLVPPNRWHEATRALLADGARIHDLYERPFTATHDYALPLMTREGVVIELHRYLCERPAFAPPYTGPHSLFAHARPHPDGVLIPDPEDLFLGLAVHAAHHGLCLPFRAIVDGLVLGQDPSLRPDVVVARAHAWRARRATACFVAVLVRFGLPPLPWRRVLEDLGTTPALAELAAAAPWPENAPAPAGDVLARRMALLDSRPRRLALLAQRLALRLGDRVLGRLFGG